MLVIKNNVTTRIEINKSIFITKLIKVNSLEQIKLELQAVKKEYKDATHYCYGYIIDNYQKSSDDSEPSGTAGIPIMDVLLKNNLTNILCIVIRYFGGIKLGSGGLIRAYSKSVTTAINNAVVTSLIDGYILKIKSSYKNQKMLEQIIKDYHFNKEYDEEIKYIVYADSKLLNKLKECNIKFEIKEKSKIEL